MKKIFIMLAIVLTICTCSFAQDDNINNAVYYKSKIESQGLRYSEAGFIYSINSGMKNAAYMFVKSGMNPDTTFMAIPASFYAVKSNQNEILNMLIQNGADVNYETLDCNLIMWSIYRKNTDAVKILINNGLDVNKEFKGFTPLNYALKRKQDGIVEILIEAGAKPDEKTLKRVKKYKNESIKNLVLDAYNAKNLKD